MIDEEAAHAEKYRILVSVPGIGPAAAAALIGMVPMARDSGAMKRQGKFAADVAGPAMYWASIKLALSVNQADTGTDGGRIGSNPLQTGIGADSIQGKQQTPVAIIMRQQLAAGRAFEAAQELRIEHRLLQNIEKTRHLPGPAGLVLQAD